MIGKHVRNTKKTSSFFALNTYILSGGNLNGKSDKVAYANCINLHSLETATIEMEMMQLTNKRSRRPVIHILLSWREGEQPSYEQVDEAVAITLKELDLQDCQAVYALHQNTDNFHLHICANRISPITHKAIDPAHGWTDKAMERAARKVEAAQGWEIEQNAWTRITEDGHIEYLNKEYNNDYLPKRNSQRINDMENASGEEAAISKGKSIILPLLNNKDTRGWGDFHIGLAAEGIVFEKKGAGAILRIGDVVVKASSISRSCTLRNLEKKLGAFEESDYLVDETAKNRLGQPSPTKEAKSYNNWEQYAQGRTEYYQQKKRKKELLGAKHAAEWQTLKQTQADDRKEIQAIVKQPLKGRAGQYQKQTVNALRSALAAQQAAERVTLKEQQKEERDKFYRENPPYQSYKEWLASHGFMNEAQRWRYKRELDREHRMSIPSENIATAPQAHLKPAKARDIRDYVAKISENRKQVLFINKRNEEVAFIDSGRFLNILKNDDADLLAALQLASQKWGSVELKGTEEYKRRCVELAVQNNIKITNPELQDAIHWAKERNRKIDRGGQDMQKELDNFRRYHAAVGADRYAVSAIEFFENGQNRGFMVNKKDGFPDGFPAANVEKSMKRLVGLKEHGRNIYYTPISENKHHILIDDLDGLALADLISQGYKPAVIIESSPANYQAIITIPKLGTDFDREIGNKIVVKLNQEFGDPKLTGEIHAHRAPGFDNKKLKHRRPDGTFPEVRLIEAKGGECDKTRQLALEIKSELEKLNKDKEVNLDFVVSAPENANTVRAYKAHFRDVVRLQKKAGNEKIDASRVDYMVCMRLRATGHSAEAIEKVLITAAQEARKTLKSSGSHDWENYARRTTAYVFTAARVDREIEKNKGYIDHWRSLEGQKKVTAIEASER